MLTLDEDATAKLWSGTNGEFVSGLGDWAWVDGCQFGPDGKTALLVSRNGWARLWDLAQDKQILCAQHGGAVIDAALSVDGKRLATVGTDQTARLWDTTTGSPIGPPLAHGETVDNVVFNADGNLLATRTAGGVIRIWNLQNAGELRLKHDRAVRTACFSPSGHRLLTTTDSEVEIWSLAKLTSVHLGVDTQVYCADFSPDGTLVATGTEDGILRLWNVQTGSLEKALPHDRRVEAVVFGPKGKRLATASNTELCVWDLPGAKKVRSFRCQGPISHVEFDHSGALLLSLDFEANVRVWQVRSRPVSLCFSPDDKCFAASDEASGGARVWNSRTGVPVTPPLAHQGRVRHVAFSPDGRMLVTASADKTARVWDPSTAPPSASRCGMRTL